MAARSEVPRWETGTAYAGDNYLQTYNVYNGCEGKNGTNTWVVYIHGGYFRDPLVLADSFHATVNGSLANSPDISFATIDYRLSAHSAHPQAADTPAFDLRNARWPQHLDDVFVALKQLQTKYKFGSNYILVGHSVGAQMALLAALKATERDFAAPKLVLGLSGIYDFPMIHEAHPEYKPITFNAIEEGEEIAASPARYSVQDYKDAGVLQVILGHSKDDGLVPWNQVDRMEAVLSQDDAGYVQTLELFGAHNDIWRDGRESARALEAALEIFNSR
jgi:acetyl esterase/lipase